jgi:hypothetical protein
MKRIPHRDELEPARGDAREFESHADGGGPARREQHTVQISRGDFTEALGKFNGPLAGVTARAKTKFIKLMFDGSNDAGMPEADLMHVVTMEVEITPAFDVFNPRALSLRQRVEARCRKALMQEVTRVGFEQRLRPRPDVFGSPDVASGERFTSPSERR